MSVERSQIIKKKDPKKTIKEIQGKILGDLFYMSFLLATQLFHIEEKSLEEAKLLREELKNTYKNYSL